jgi:hypothetical protein
MALRASSVLSQSVLDRVVGPYRELPLTLTTEDPFLQIPRLSEAVGVPMGFEKAPRQQGSAETRHIQATSRRLRDVLDDIIKIDPRYEWREDAGVVVIRPVDAWNRPSVLDTLLGPVTLENATSDDADHVVHQVFSLANDEEPRLRNIKRFSVDVPADTPLLQFVNAVVRAHGSLSWTLDPLLVLPAVVCLGCVKPSPMFMLTFIGEPVSVGHGLLLNATIQPGPYTVHRAPLGTATTGIPALDHIIGEPGRPLKIVTITQLSQVARAAGVPMGLQLATRNRSIKLRPFEPVDVSGMVLRDALELIRTGDPQFEWREMNGVIVFRPVESWSDPQDPLARPTSAVAFKDVPIGVALQPVLSTVGHPDPPRGFQDKKRVSIELPPGTLLDLLNATVRAHGELSWGWGNVGHVPLQEGSVTLRHEVRFAFFTGDDTGVEVP